MERRKSRSAAASPDPSAAEKAAAWAWYQRGSGTQGRPLCEFHVSRPRHAPIPSRYKIEAMIGRSSMAENEQGPVAAVEKKDEVGSAASSPSNLSHISLFDTYEIERISRQLDYLIERSSKLYKEKKFVLMSRGFWARHAVVCGTKDDVLERSVPARRQPLPRRPVRKEKGGG